MNYAYELDLVIGKILGRNASCGTKFKYKTLDKAKNVRKQHNNSNNTYHKVHIYNCFFCGDYHLGKPWHKDDIELLLKSELNGEELELYLGMLESWSKSELRNNL